MRDTITLIGQSLIQHGKHNDRIYLMKLSPADLPGIIDELDSLAEKNKYGKIFAKIPKTAKQAFTDHGYGTEARIPRFYNDSIDCFFMAKYLSPERNKKDQENAICDVLSPGTKPAPKPLPEGFAYGPLEPKDTIEAAEAYAQTFETYPFPIHDPRYLAESMKRDIKYRCIRTGGKIAALASSETDYDAKTVEFTDFATLPAYRGKGLSTHLLVQMEDETKQEGIKLGYTIARAKNTPINRLFRNRGYTYAGTLTKNTNISGTLQDMNVWYKRLAD
ncbi:MAG: putative beta-lysine N-acetyltransferase [Candidatus Altiarchaeota archaeon]|nr:putative beta-lysine N-acetyltransferase [Candidatus Altiarchaeota archaeon]